MDGRVRPSSSPLSTDLNAEEAMHISAFRPRSLARAHPKAQLPIHLVCFLDAVKVLKCSSATVSRVGPRKPASRLQALRPPNGPARVGVVRFTGSNLAF